MCALTYGEYDAATSQLQRAFDLVVEQGVGNPRIIPFAANLVEAHVRGCGPEQAGPAVE